ncbi:hypothetical protein [uncultured Aquincola sp.]|tara:strand:- start:1263 stop:1385 length:123 start_codon:yes stop_codon:yes gene_type:complete
MNDPRRHLPPAPHGRVPNWVIAAIAGVVVVLSYVGRAVIG